MLLSHSLTSSGPGHRESSYTINQRCKLVPRVLSLGAWRWAEVRPWIWGCQRSNFAVFLALSVLLLLCSLPLQRCQLKLTLYLKKNKVNIILLLFRVHYNFKNLVWHYVQPTQGLVGHDRTQIMIPFTHHILLRRIQLVFSSLHFILHSLQIYTDRLRN